MTHRTVLTAGVALAALLVGAGPIVAPSAALAQSGQSVTEPRYLQLGSFTNEANARRLLDQFFGRPLMRGVAQGLIEPRMVGSTLYHRVRVGPIYSEAQAAQALAEARAMGLGDATLSPDLSAPAPVAAYIPTPAPQATYVAPAYDPNVATASLSTTLRYVQIGSFNDLTAATRLLTQARSVDPSFDGVIHSVGRRGGAVHRVLIGPFSADAEAAAAAARLTQTGVIAYAPAGPAASGAIGTRSIPTPVVTPAPAAVASSFLNVGAYRVPTNAHQALDRLRRSGMDNGAFGRGQIDSVTVNGETLWRVRFGPIDTPERANQALSLAQIMGYRDAQIQPLR